MREANIYNAVTMSTKTMTRIAAILKDPKKNNVKNISAKDGDGAVQPGKGL